MRQKTLHRYGSRIHLMDELRGFAVLCMVFYHAFYDLASLFSVGWGQRLLDFFQPAEPFFAALFILISGISSRLARSNLVRGAKLLAVALLMTAVTFWLFPEEQILFGILHLLAFSMLFFALFEKAFNKISPIVGMLITAALFWFSFHLHDGYVGFSPWFKLSLPAQAPEGFFFFILGFPDAHFSSADYFPLFPWLFIFLMGTFWGVYAQANRFPRFTYVSRSRPLQFLGRHALMIYILHQPVLYGLFKLIEMVIRK